MEASHGSFRLFIVRCTTLGFPAWWDHPGVRALRRPHDRGILVTWQTIPDGGRRFEVPSGWIVETPGGGATFVPDYTKVWKIVDPSTDPDVGTPPINPLPPTPPSPPAPPAPFTTSMPDIVQYMSINNGVWKSVDGFQSRAASLQFQIPDVKPRDLITVELDIKAKLPWGNRNVKVPLRVWSPGFKQPNFYIGKPPAAGFMFYVEPFDPYAGDKAVRFYFQFPPYDGVNWRHEEYQWTVPSGLGKSDGSFQIKIDDHVIFRTDKLQLNDAQNPFWPSLVCLQTDYSPNQGDAGPFPSDSFFWVKDDTLLITRQPA